MAAELNRENLLDRLRAYPQYVQRIAGVTYDEFVRNCADTPQSESLLRRFVEQFVL